MMKQEKAEIIKAATGLEGDQVSKLHPGLEKLFRNIHTHDFQKENRT